MSKHSQKAKAQKALNRVMLLLEGGNVTGNVTEKAHNHAQNVIASCLATIKAHPKQYVAMNTAFKQRLSQEWCDPRDYDENDRYTVTRVTELCTNLLFNYRLKILEKYTSDVRCVKNTMSLVAVEERFNAFYSKSFMWNGQQEGQCVKDFTHWRNKKHALLHPSSRSVHA